MKPLILIFALIATFATGQIKIDDGKFIHRETEFKITGVEKLDDGFMVFCYWENPKGEKEKYTFFLNEKAEVMAFYEHKFKRMIIENEKGN